MNCSSLISIEVDAGNTKYDSRNNCNAIIHSSSNELIIGCKNTTIPNSVTSIGHYAFNYCTSLTSIYIPNSVTSIGEHAFEGSSLTSIHIPNSVTSIENRVFEFCSNLTSVTIPNSVTRIGRDVFQDCFKLNSITCLAKTPPTCYSYVSPSSHVTLHVLPGCKNAYENAEYWTGLIVEDAKDIINIKLGTSNYTTYCSDMSLDFTEVEGLKAYTATGFDPKSGNLMITRVDNIPANEGVLLKGTASKTYEIPTTEDAYVFANLFKGNTTAFTLYPTDGNNTNFVLTKNSEGKMGFYRFTDTVSMPTNKAWLQIPTSALGANATNVKGFNLVEIDDEVTGITDLKAESADNNVIHDLQGRRLNKPAHGLYIKNRKKYVK